MASSVHQASDKNGQGGRILGVDFQSWLFEAVCTGFVCLGGFSSLVESACKFVFDYHREDLDSRIAFLVSLMGLIQWDRRRFLRLNGVSRPPGSLYINLVGGLPGVAEQNNERN